MFWRKPYQPLNQVVLDLEALRSNLNLFREKLPTLAVAPVLKSNAYGHGLREIVKALKKENCPFFVVDSIYEAYKIREVDSKTPLLILGYNFEKNLRKKAGFHFTAGSLDQLEILAKRKLPIHLELNTGMNRMGFHWRNPEQWLEKWPSTKPTSWAFSPTLPMQTTRMTRASPSFRWNDSKRS